MEDFQYMIGSNCEQRLIAQESIQGCLSNQAIFLSSLFNTEVDDEMHDVRESMEPSMNYHGRNCGPAWYKVNQPAPSVH